MAKNAPTITVDAGDLVLCNDGSSEAYYTACPSTWSLGALGSGGGGSLAYAPYDVEIVQPQAALDTKNRFYKAYPALEYNVKVSVRGGDFSALTYSLTTAPSGMTIDSSTGVITWANPTASGSPHNITASVTDGRTTDSVSWTLTVTTSGFVFVDANASGGGTGTLADPFNDFLDFYGANEADATYQDYFVYFRAGTHVVNSNANTGNNGAQWGSQKPVVFLAYPAESVIFDWGSVYLFADADCSNMYVDGMSHINVGDHAADGGGVFAFRTFGDNITFRRNDFSDIRDMTGSYNQAYIMSVSSDGNTKRNNWSITENTFDGNNANAYAVCCLYDTQNAVIESNLVSNSGNIGVGIKTRNDATTVRGNWAEGTSNLYWLYNEFGAGGNHEVSWNFGNASAGNSFTYNHALATSALPAHVIRNTFLESTYYRELVTANALVSETDNVIVSSDTNNASTENGIDFTRLIQSGNLVNAAEANFVSPTTGLLISTYVSQNANKGQNGLGGLK